MTTNENNGAATIWNVAFVAMGYMALIMAVMFFANLPFSPGLPFTFIKAQHWTFPRWFSTAIGCIVALVVGAQMLNPFKVRDVYGGAHFATESEIKSKLFLRASTGLILGMTIRSFMGFKWGRYLRVERPLSVLVYAPPGTGKTSGIIIPSLLAEKGSCLVMDPKGEICDITRPVKAKTHKIIRFAPAEPGSAQWNPLSKTELPKSFEETQAYVGRIAEALIIGSDNGSDQHWIESGRALFRFWAMFLIWRDGETSLGTIVKESVGGIAGAQAALNLVLEDYSAKLPDEIKVEGFKFSRMEGAQFDGVIGTLNTKTKLFSDKTVATNTSKSDFTFGELRAKPTAIYFVIPINDMARMKPLVSLFFQVATDVFLAAMPKAEIRDKKKHLIQKADETITMYLDEFVQMGKMPSVIKMPSVGRGFRVRAVFILQSFSQLQSVYGDKEASALRNNCSYHVVFAQNEEKMAEDISKSIGNRTRVKKSKNTSHTITPFQGGSESEEGIPLVRVQDITSLAPGMVLIMAQSSFETPVYAHAALYYKDKTMTDLLEGIASSKIPDESDQLTPNPIPVPTLAWTQTSEDTAVEAIAMQTSKASSEAVQAANQAAKPQEPQEQQEEDNETPYQAGGEIGDTPPAYKTTPPPPAPSAQIPPAQIVEPGQVAPAAPVSFDELDPTLALLGSGNARPASEPLDEYATGEPFEEDEGPEEPLPVSAQAETEDPESDPLANPNLLDTISDDEMHTTFDGVRPGL